MKSILVPAVLAFCSAAAAAMATTPYQANVADTVCDGDTACKLGFPIVAAGETLTIQHISCSITTSGEQGGIYTMLLTSAKAPEVSVAGSSNVVSGASDGCFISGYETP